MRYGQGSLWHLLEFVERSCVADKFVIHVNEEVIPINVDRNGGCAFDVKFEESLQMSVVNMKICVHCIHLVYLQGLCHRGRTLVLLQLYLTFGSLSIYEGAE